MMEQLKKIKTNLSEDSNLKEILHIFILITATLVIGTYFISEYLVDYHSASQSILNYHLIIRIGLIIAILIFSVYTSYDISKSFFSKLGISYILYLLVSYFLLATQNINNKEFDLLDFSKNKFFELDSWWLIGVILCLSYIIQWLSTKSKIVEKIDEMLYDYSESHLSLALLVSLIVIQDSKLLANLKQYLALSNGGNLQSYLETVSYKLPLIIFTVTLVTYTFWNAIDGIRRNKSTLSLAIVSSFLFALIFNYSIQYGIKADADYLGEYIFAGATLFQIAILTAVYMIVYFVINRYWLSSIFIIFSGLAVTIANSVKFKMRSEPLLITDFSMLTQLDLIFGYVNIKLLVFSIVLIILLIFIYFYLRNKYLKGKIFSSIKKRIVLTLSILSLFSGIITLYALQGRGQTFNNIPVFSRLNSRNISFTGHATSARYQSLMHVWMKQLTKPIMLKPDNYSKEAIDKLVKKYQKRASEINESRTQNIEDETVIFILSESLSDPRRLKGVTLSENVLKNIDQIKSQTTSGLMKSDAYGGGTANIEIQTLLGLPFYNLSPSIAIYNVEAIPKMSILPSISDSFLPDNRYVVHLGETTLYSRADVYNRLGFGSFIADDKNAVKPTINEKYGGFPSDQSTYQNVLDKLDTDKSQFFSVITYQNHVPWSMSEPASIVGEGEEFTAEENESLSNYIRLLKETDIRTKEFLDQLSKMDKKITVVFYGDHLPGFYPESTFTEDPESKYLTDYFIWSNKDNQKKEYDKLNSSDFPAAVLAHTNSKVSPYYALLTDVLENASVDKTKLTEEGDEIANDLKLVQYDITSGKDYLGEYQQFFEFKK